MKKFILYSSIIFLTSSCRNELLKTSGVNQSVSNNLNQQNSTTIIDNLQSGTHQGTLLDSTNSIVRLNSSTAPCNTSASNCTLSASWAPQWNHLISYYQMEESAWTGITGEVHDSIGSNHGTRVGNATTNTNSMIETRAGYFDGISSKVNVSRGGDRIRVKMAIA